jgi:uncharacterized damage-inducible protein DinB
MYRSRHLRQTGGNPRVKELLKQLMQHTRWADAMFADALDSEIPHADAVRLFAHIASVEHLWYSRIRGQPPVHAVWPALTVSDARTLAATHADRFDELLAGDDAELERIVAYRNSLGRDYRNSVGDIITHVAMHGSHHRGQIARLLREAGREPPYTDYIQFARRGQ